MQAEVWESELYSIWDMYTKADIDFCSKNDNIVLNRDSRGRLDKLHETR